MDKIEIRNLSILKIIMENEDVKKVIHDGKKPYTVLNKIGYTSLRV